MSQLGQFNSLYGSVDSITGNDGIAITPLIGNVNLLGAAPFTVTGVLATATLTISSDGSIALTYTTDAGNAVAALDTISVLGGANVSTTGAASTITVNLSGTTDNAIQTGNAAGSLTSLPIGNDGELLLGATAAASAWSSLASAGATVVFTPGPNSLSLDVSGIVASSFPTDAGTATPAIGALSLLGGTNINTAGALNAATINLDDHISITSMVTDDLAAGLSISGDDIYSDGTDANISINITPKGTGVVAIDNLSLGDNTIASTDINGNIVLNPNGVGTVNIDYATEHAIATYAASGALSEIGPLTNGQLIIGSTGLAASAATLSSAGGTIAFTLGAGTLNLETAGVLASSYLTDDANSAVPALGVLTVAGGANIGTTSGASTVTVALNGTTDHAIQLGNATASLTSLALGTATQILQSGGAADPAWSTATYPATTAQGDVMFSSADNTVTGLTKDAAATRYIANTGAGNNPAWDQVELTNGVSGILPVANGGAGVSTLTSHGILMGNGAGDIQALAEATDGQIPIGSTGNNPTLATLSAGVGVSITNAAGSITVAATGGGIGWEVVTDATKTMVIDVAYGANRGAGVTFTLPATAAAGSRFEIVGMAGLWVLAQNAGQTVYIGDTNTTAGVGGSLTATDAGDCMELICTVSDTNFRVFSMMGNLTVV